MSIKYRELKSLNKSADANENLYRDAAETHFAYELLERFPSPVVGTDNKNGVTLALNIKTNEFTSLCPVTGQPDFAEIIIDYIPDQWCVESKSLKLYFLSFRERRDFHESCVMAICNDLVSLLNPKWIKVEGRFTPRGGIPFWPTCEWKQPS